MKAFDLVSELKIVFTTLSKNVEESFDVWKEKFKGGVGYNEILGQPQVVYEILVLDKINDDDYGLIVTATISDHKAGISEIEVALLRSFGPIIQKKNFKVSGQEDLKRINQFVRVIENEIIKMLRFEHLKK